jgi:hypothetical protein
MAEIFNDDIVGIYRRINKFIEELQKSASANVADVNVYDKIRFTSYFNALTQYVNWVKAQPSLDLPETHPKHIELEAPPEIQDVENLMIRDLVRLLERGRDELINSASARNATNLIVFDESRFRAVIEKAENFIDGFISTVSPIDLPESSPLNSDSGPGRTGINPR